jgi:hypothetical protein
MVAVLRDVDAFNNRDAKAMAAVCADPMQILDGITQPGSCPSVSRLAWDSSEHP